MLWSICFYGLDGSHVLSVHSTDTFIFIIILFTIFFLPRQQLWRVHPLQVETVMVPVCVVE